MAIYSDSVNLQKLGYAGEIALKIATVTQDRELARTAPRKIEIADGWITRDGDLDAD